MRYVALGKRRINPHRGSWSISGGRRDSGDANYRATALREFREDT
ncbi:NUDIX domain-containing protein [Spirochaeta africana]